MQDSAAFALHLAVPVRLVVCPLVHVNFASGILVLAVSVLLVVLVLAHVDLASREKRVLALSIPLAVCPLAHVDLAREKRVLAVSAHQAVFVLAHVDFAGGIVCVPCLLGIPSFLTWPSQAPHPKSHHCLVRLFASFVRANRLGQWSRQPLDLVQKKKTEEAQRRQ